MASKTQAIDNAELSRLLLEGKGCISYAKVVVDYDEDNADETTLLAAIEGAMEANLLSNLDIKTANLGALYIVASEKTWELIPSANVNYATSSFIGKCTGALAIFRGSYIDQMEDGKVNIYAIFSGLNVPHQRLEELRGEVGASDIIAKQKEAERDKSLELSTSGKEKHISKLEEVKAKIAKSNSPFGKFLSQNTVVDRRKK
jgi:hypothetical protein